jgi:hypothetical protein
VSKRKQTLAGSIRAQEAFNRRQAEALAQEAAHRGELAKRVEALESVLTLAQRATQGIVDIERQRLRVPVQPEPPKCPKCGEPCRQSLTDHRWYCVAPFSTCQNFVAVQPQSPTLSLRERMEEALKNNRTVPTPEDAIGWAARICSEVAEGKAKR